MRDRQEDEGDVSDPWEAATAELARPVPPADDYARHVRAEQRWQAKLAAARLWERVKRCFAGLEP